MRENFIILTSNRMKTVKMGQLLRRRWIGESLLLIQKHKKPRKNPSKRADIILVWIVVW